MSFRSQVIQIINEFLAAAKKISQLTAAASVNSSDEIEINQNGVSKKATVSQIAGATASTIPINWDFVAEAGYPSDLTKVYLSTDVTESIYPFGTLFWTNGSGGWYTK